MQTPVFRQEALDRRLDEYVDLIVAALGHADRVEPFTLYLAGLLGEGERKSVEPMAARLAPARVNPEHQSLLHFVGESPWSDVALLRAVRDYALPSITGSAGIKAWIADDTGIPKKGIHSVGVSRQYCGVLGKQENCQVAVTLSVANEVASLPVAYRLYLPESWVADRDRRRETHIPEDVVFLTKPEISLEQIRTALADGLEPTVVLADAGYGDNTNYRDGLTALKLTYVVGIKPTTTVWPEGTGPLLPKRYSGRGARPHRLRRDLSHQPISVRGLALGLPSKAFRKIQWRQGTAEALKSRFCALRVRPAHGDLARDVPRPVEWLLIEWPDGEAEPTKYFFSTLPATTSLRVLVQVAKMRWRIERDYEELKGEIGLDHFEGRSWRGFHHHGTMCIAAYAFLAAERGRFPPGRSFSAARLKAPALPRGFRPRGSPDSARATQSDIHRHNPPRARRSTRRSTSTVPHLSPRGGEAKPRPKK